MMDGGKHMRSPRFDNNFNFIRHPEFGHCLNTHFTTTCTWSWCSGDIWHVSLEGLPGSGICYGYRVSGTGGWDTGFRWDASRVLLDPYAPLVSGRRFFGKRDAIEKFQQKVR